VCLVIIQQGEKFVKLVKAWEDNGVEMSEPCQRRVKILLAPDKGGVDELLFSSAVFPRGGRTDYHTHDRAETIYVVSGEGMCVHEGEETPIREDMVMYVPAGEKHQIVNTGYEPMKVVAIFVPGFSATDHYKRLEDAARSAQS
jgi:mannose-6-phosphate isomerase-like protein (cupin superfamily)